MNGSDPYLAFLEAKAAKRPPSGIKSVRSLPASLKPFQRDIVTWSLRQGQCAIFAGTGLGKTAMQLSWADAICRDKKGRAIILTPLAVAQQTVGEAKKFGIEGVAYAKEMKDADTRIVVTNYERAEKFDMSQFVAFVADESSILKAHESKTRALLTELCHPIHYKLCCTATPSPNDYTELGQHAEFLGVLTAKEMLATWFVHEGSSRATNVKNHGVKQTSDWRLKRHAEKDFWRWVSTWAVMIRHPRDLGYEEEGYDLPPLVKKQVTVSVPYEPDIDAGTLFPMEAVTLSDQRKVSRSTIDVRVKAAVDLIQSEPDEPWLVWCQLNDEADAMCRALPGLVEIRGSDDADIKIERLMGFATGSIDWLITKSTIAGHGMNWQRCARQIHLGINHSFEQQFQAIRRSWRFGQTRPVHIYVIAAETEGAVVASFDAKEAAAERMAEQMAEHMKDLTRRSLRGPDKTTSRASGKRMEVPSWLR